MYLRYLLCILCSGSSIFTAGGCPADWIHIEQSCFTGMAHNQTWLTASSYCQSFGANLASVQTHSKNMLITQYLKSKQETGPVWLSGTDLMTETHWMWTPSDQPVTFNNWAPHHDDHDGEDCLVINIDRGGWVDRECNEKYHFLCERSF